MEARSAGQAAVDVCGACAGLWIDWFDGEIATLTRRAKLPIPPARATDEPSRDQRCPRCRGALTLEALGQSRLAALRCGECAGVFVPRDVAAEIERGVDVSDPAPDVTTGPSLFSRLASTVRELFGGS